MDEAEMETRRRPTDRLNIVGTIDFVSLAIETFQKLSRPRPRLWFGSWDIPELRRTILKKMQKY